MNDGIGAYLDDVIEFDPKRDRARTNETINIL